MVGAEIVDR